MALSTFRANTFQADTFQLTFNNAVDAVVALATKDGVLQPFKRVAVTPEVMAQIQADWSVHYPVIDSRGVRVPPVLVPKQPATPVDIPAADNVVPLTREAIIALPQFNQLVRTKVAKPIAGVSVETALARMEASGAIGQSQAGAAPPSVTAETFAYRTLLLPDTVRNPTDEELVAIALGIV